jgi:hypothetical protein
VLQDVGLHIGKRAKYIEGLENRLGRMEHLLRLSGTSAAAPSPSWLLVGSPSGPDRLT